ncbi:putative metal homeostasis protein [Enterococcus faecium]|nr:putative metal homeostasis protein [Enterococcus faecium]NRE63019.1 putative metal homeostasis protein [Enterococcus faecium]
MEKTNISSAYPRLKSPKIKTRKNVRKIIKYVKRNSGNS